MPESQPGIQPLPLGQPITNSGDAQPSAPIDRPSLDERVDQWLDAHPDGKTFDDKAVAAPSPPTTEQPPTTEAPAQPQAETPPAAASIETQPQVQPQQPPSAQALPTEKPVEPPPTEAPKLQATRFSLDSKYTFAEGGPEWSGQQIVDGLRERQALMPKAQEADTYREVFEMPAAQAKELWAPNIAWLRNNPNQVQMIASIIDDPTKASYILQCSQYWDSPEGREVRAQQAPQQQPQLQMSPEVETRFKQLEAQNQQLLSAETERKKGFMHQRIQRELNVAFERYPYLRDNPTMVQALLARAYWLNNGDDSENSRGVLDALDMERDLYDSKLSALSQASSIVRDAAAPPPPVPPLVGSTGAAPQASQPSRNARPKDFSTLDDAVDDWVNNPPAQFR